VGEVSKNVCNRTFASDAVDRHFLWA
jgi:hypothetical protein